MSDLCSVDVIAIFSGVCFRNCKKLGTQSWILLAIIFTEALVVFKFDWQTITLPLPPLITILWLSGLAGLALWTVWHFYLQRLLWHTEKKLELNSKDETLYQFTNGVHDTEINANHIVSNGTHKHKGRNVRSRARNHWDRACLGIYFQWGMSPSGHCWDYYPGALSSWSSRCISFEDRIETSQFPLLVPYLQMHCSYLTKW